jgi:hypothetical protein
VGGVQWREQFCAAAAGVRRVGYGMDPWVKARVGAMAGVASANRRGLRFASAGGSAADIFVFDSALNATTNVDQITDYNVTDDTIRLENAIFTALTTTGTLAAAAFVANTLGRRDDDQPPRHLRDRYRQAVVRQQRQRQRRLDPVRHGGDRAELYE